MLRGGDVANRCTSNPAKLDLSFSVSTTPAFAAFLDAIERVSGNGSVRPSYSVLPPSNNTTLQRKGCWKATTFRPNRMRANTGTYAAREKYDPNSGSRSSGKRICSALINATQQSDAMTGAPNGGSLPVKRKRRVTAGNTAGMPNAYAT